MEKVGNNGSRAVYHMHDNGTLLDGMTLEQVAEILRPDMVNPKHLDNDDFWEDFIYTAANLGYILYL